MQMKEVKFWGFQALPVNTSPLEQVLKPLRPVETWLPHSKYGNKAIIYLSRCFWKGGGNRQGESKVTDYCLHCNTQEWFA